MKKGDFVTINENQKYSGQDMRWTEQVTGTTTLKSGTKLYHFSDRKLIGFFPKETCFFLTKKSFGHVYEMTLKEDTNVRLYSDEVRIDIDENDKIKYIGDIKIIREYAPNGGCQIGSKIKDNTI